MQVLDCQVRPLPAVEPTVVQIVTDVDALERAAAREFVQRARRAVEERGLFTVVLGNDPTLQGVYRRLAHRSTWRELSPELLEDSTPWGVNDRRDSGQAGATGGAGPVAMRDQVPWHSVHVFFTDERHVGPGHPDSNVTAVGRSLLAHVPLPASNIHRIHGEEGSAAQAARDYERHLLRFFAAGDNPGRPHFDLVMLGLGPDAETAALHAGVGQNGDRSGGNSGALVAAPWVARLGTHRITLTPEILSSTDCVLFAVAGSARAVAVRETLQGLVRPGSCPARLVRPENGEVRWVIDRAAAGLLDLRG